MSGKRGWIGVFWGGISGECCLGLQGKNAGVPHCENRKRFHSPALWKFEFVEVGVFRGFSGINREC